MVSMTIFMGCDDDAIDWMAKITSCDLKRKYSTFLFMKALTNFWLDTMLLGSAFINSLGTRKKEWQWTKNKCNMNQHSSNWQIQMILSIKMITELPGKE